MNQKLLNDKKGQSKTLITGVTVVVVTLVLLILMLYMFSTISTTLPTESRSVINETGGVFANGTGYPVLARSNTTYPNPRDYVLFYAYDNVQNYTISNVTINSNGYLINSTLTTYKKLNISYSYTYDSASITGTQTTITGIGNAVPLALILLTIVIIVGIIGALLTIVVIKGGRKYF